jgi:vanillate/3-O-methylgallate O-demethylase
LESGWIPIVTPAIYTQVEMKAYREHLPAFSLEGLTPIEGSFVSDDIEDYYHYPWELGYGSFMKFDHDFIGRSALEKLADAPRRRKAWREWNRDDVVRVIRDSLFGAGDRPKILDVPTMTPSTIYHDSVLKGDRLIGTSTVGGYTVNTRQVATVAVLDEAEVRDGEEVEVVWGEPDGGAGRPFMEPHHVQTTIRATIHTRRPRQD